MTPTVGEVYQETLDLLPNLKSYEIALRELICYVNNFDDMSEFYFKKQQKFHDLDTFRAYLARFLNNEPIQYITKRASFLGHYFYVDERVLIPRMETEEVVDFAIKKIKETFEKQRLNVVDIGTGSGIIAVSIKRHFPEANVYASDLSTDALDVAKMNAEKQQLQVSFLSGDHLTPLIVNHLKVDVIISNPPYIESEKELEKSVAEFEPKKALIIDHEHSVYENILKNHHHVLDEKLLIIFEIGEKMKEEIERLISQYVPQAKYEIIQDLNKKDRIVSILITKEK